MRFLHTADWHLGRIMHGVHLTDDQAFVLAQVVEIARDAKVDAVIIAGDVYDRAVPPSEAVQLLDDTLFRLSLDVGAGVVLIAGNHDSPERIEFGARLFAARKVFITGVARGGYIETVFEDAWGPVHVYASPYMEPVELRTHMPDGDIRDHDSAMGVVVSSIWARHPKGRRSVFVGHGFVTGGAVSESERPLTVGGTGCVDASRFIGFSYTALGHLHQRQAVGDERIRYSGALMKYAFSEAETDKSVEVVELDETGGCHVEKIALCPRHDVRCVEGMLEDVLKGPAPGENRDDYIMVRLRDQGPILDVMHKLRAVYPNVLHVERTMLSGALDRAPALDHRSLSDGDLFTAFFKQVTGEAPSAEAMAVYGAAVDAVRRADMEVGS